MFERGLGSFEAPEHAFEALQPVVLMLPALDPVAQRALQVPLREGQGAIRRRVYRKTTLFGL